MEPLYQKKFHIPASAVDRFDRLKMSHILDYLQEVAGDHSALLGTDRQNLNGQHLFWAVIRHRVQITRLPKAGEDITVETWPMPTTRTAYPRATVALDSQGNELFKSISLWVLMDSESRTMVLPKKSGIVVDGRLQGNELPPPGSLIPREMECADHRTVRFTDLDWNGHMNNCRYLDWVADLLPADFHREHCAKEFTVCYLSEATEGETVTLLWEQNSQGVLHIDAHRENTEMSVGHSRVFAAQILF